MNERQGLRFDPALAAWVAGTPTTYDRLFLAAVAATGAERTCFHRQCRETNKPSMSRHPRNTLDRYKIYWWLRHAGARQGLSFPDIAEITGGPRSSHCSVLDAIRRCEQAGWKKPEKKA